MNDSFIPQSLTFQWHVTERCNRHCKHCYQNENVSTDLGLEKLFDIFDQFLSLIKKWQIPPKRVFFSITGGEPLLRKDIFQFLDRVGKYSYLYQWGILTNGSLLCEDNLKRLKELDVSYVQVSLEGTEKNNDEIRGKGSFQETVEALKILTKIGIFSRVSLTLTKKNAGDITSLVKLLDGLGVECLGIRRLIPWGRGKEMEKYLLSPQELREIYLKMKEINRKLLSNNRKLSLVSGCESGMFNKELLSDPLRNMQPNSCGVPAGRSMAVMANGDIFPCRRFPVLIGNVLQNNLEDIYYSEKMRDFLSSDKLHIFCRSCAGFSRCFGGAKCVTYAYTGKDNIPDVQCWRAYKKLNEPLF